MITVASLHENRDATVFTAPSLRHDGWAIFTIRRIMWQRMTHTSVFLTYLSPQNWCVAGVVLEAWCNSSNVWWRPIFNALHHSYACHEACVRFWRNGILEVSQWNPIEFTAPLLRGFVAWERPPAYIIPDAGIMWRRALQGDASA